MLSAPQQLFERIADAITCSPDLWFQEYERSFREAHAIENCAKSRKTILSLSGQLDFSSVYTAILLNDVCLLGVHSGDSKLSMIDNSRMRNISPLGVMINLPQNANAAVIRAVREKAMFAGFIYPTGSESHQFLSALSPLIRAGHLLPSPTRVVVYREKITEEGRTHWNMIDVPFHSPFDAWNVPAFNASEGDSEPTLVSDHDGDERAIMSALVPVVYGVSSQDMAEILRDEQDVIAEFRSSIRETMRIIRKDGNAKDLYQDVIRPATSRLERRFSQIVRLGRLRVAGAAIGTMTVTLVSGFSAGLGTAITALAGTSGAGLTLKEWITYSGEKSGLKEDPMYLLWRLSRR